LYRRLSQLLGDAPDGLTSNRNAQVALSKWAYYASELGRHDEAASGLDRLLLAFPANKDYLRRNGLAHFQAGNFKQALNAWRTLLAGVEKGSDDWFEAKYYQLMCLLRTDEAIARQVWNQFRLLYPNLGSSAWRDRFAELGRQLDTAR
jgi:tetratricopeptide (TPR) repeat protein